MKLEQNNVAETEDFSIFDRGPRGLGSEGTTENSPAVHCRVEGLVELSPEGTADFNRPFETRMSDDRFPALKRRPITKSPFRTPTYKDRANLKCALQ